MMMRAIARRAQEVWRSRLPIASLGIYDGGAAAPRF
jgi:hypothetical protein